MDRRRLGFAAVCLFLINALIAGRLFVTEYTNHLESIEAAYISISHQWMKHGVDLNWWPLWYNGIPGQNTYSPVLHLIVAGAGKLCGISAALAHHLVTAVFYCAGALTVLSLARVLGASVPAAFASGLLFSLWSPSIWLMPSLRHGLPAFYSPRRFDVLIRYGEGPHLAALTLLPVALIVLDRALSRRTIPWIFAAALALAAVVLTNWIAGFALAAAIAAYLLVCRPQWNAWLLTAGIGILAYVIAAPLIPPSTLVAVRTNAQIVGGPFPFGIGNLIALACAFAAMGAIAALFRHRGVSRLTGFGVLFTILMGTIVLAGEWFDFHVLPQSIRYHIELEMAICLLVAGIGMDLPARWRRIAFAALLIGAIPALYFFQFYARRMFHPIDIRSRIEYREASWIDANLAGRRVWVPGTIQFWLNSFTDTPQMGGGFAQGIINNHLPGIDFQVMSGMNAGAREGHVAADWLRAMGVSAVGVAGPQSQEFYKSVANWKKYDGVLREIWRDGDDVLYEVPQRSRSLARAVLPSQIVTQTPPDATQTQFLADYLAALDDPSLPDVSWTWVGRSSARAAGTLNPEHVLSIRINYHPGWNATVNGRVCATRPDAIGQLIVEPRCSGHCVVELAYDGGREMRIARTASGLALLAGLIAAIVPLGMKLRRLA